MSLDKTKDITILIPTNLDERLEMLKHSLNFLNQNGFEGQVVIGIWGGKREKISELRDFRLRLHFDCNFIEQSGLVIFTERVLQLINFSNRKYIMQIGDDDFLVPEILNVMAGVLETEKDIHCVQGRTLSIMEGPKDYSFIPFPMNGVMDESPLVRYSKHNGQMFHALFRTKDFTHRMGMMNDTFKVTKNHIWFEVTGDLIPLIIGKFMIVDQVFILRSKHQNNTSRQMLKNNKYEMFPYYLLSRKFSEHWEFVKFQLLATFESVGIDTSLEENKTAIYDGMLALLGSIIYGIRKKPLEYGNFPFYHLNEMLKNAKP